MPEDIDKGGNTFDANFAKGGTFDEAKEVTPSFDANDSTDVVFSDYSPVEVASYLSDHETSEEVFRVSFDLTASGSSGYLNARFGILRAEDGTSRALVGVYETATGGVAPLIFIALDGQTIGSLAKAINQFPVATAQVLNNRFSLSVNCLDDSPLQNGTNIWALFYKSATCGQAEEVIASTLKEDIRFYYTSVEPNLDQHNPAQSLGGFVSPTGLYDVSRLSQSISFYDSYIVLDSALSSYDILQIGDELMTVSEWRDSTAVISQRHAFGTPIRYQPAGSVVRGVGKNDIFNRVLSSDYRQYRCIAIKNTSETEIARDVKVFFKIASRNTLSTTRLAIEIPRSDYLSSTASSGSDISLTDGTIAGTYPDDHFVGAPLKLTSGGSSGQIRIVSGFDGALGKFLLDSELPRDVAGGDTYFVDPAPSQIVPSGIVAPSTTASQTTSPPYLISSFQSALFASNGVDINISGNRANGSDMQPNDVVYVWLERQIDDNNDEFVNSRSIITVSFSRA